MKRLLLVAAFVLLWAVPSQAAITLATACVDAAGTPGSQTWSVGITAVGGSGHALIGSIHFWASNGSNSIPNPPSDGGTNTYFTADKADGSVFGGNTQLQIFYAYNITGGSLTITATADTTNTDTMSIRVCEFQGLLSSGDPIDVHTMPARQVAPGPLSNAITTGNVTPSQNGDLVYAATLIQQTTDTLSKGTSVAYVDAAAARNYAAGEYFIQGTAAALAGTFNAVSGLGTIQSGIAAFKAAPTGGATCKGSLLLFGVGGC